MDDIKLAMLGNKEAARRLTEAGVLLPCPFCNGNADIEYDTIEPYQFVDIARIVEYTKELTTLRILAGETSAEIVGAFIRTMPWTW